MRRRVDCFHRRSPRKTGRPSTRPSPEYLRYTGVQDRSARAWRAPSRDGAQNEEPASAGNCLSPGLLCSQQPTRAHFFFFFLLLLLEIPERFVATVGGEPEVKCVPQVAILQLHYKKQILVAPEIYKPSQSSHRSAMNFVDDTSNSLKSSSISSGTHFLHMISSPTILTRTS